MKIQEPHEYSVLEPASQRRSCGRMALVRGGAVAGSSETLLSLLIEEFRAQSLPATSTWPFACEKTAGHESFWMATCWDGVSIQPFLHSTGNPTFLQGEVTVYCPVDPPLAGTGTGV